VWSNSGSVRLLDKGSLTPAERTGTVKTTKTWTTTHGKKTYEGNGRLKETQYLACVVAKSHVCCIVMCAYSNQVPLMSNLLCCD
jgi:hypothetical protein